MRFLLDESVSHRLGAVLEDAGHDVVDVSGLGLTSATDPVVLQVALDDERILVTLDTDFGTLLAHSREALPSVVLLRGDVTRHPGRQADLLLSNVGQLEHELAEGALVVTATAECASADCQSMTGGSARCPVAEREFHAVLEAFMPDRSI